MTPTRPGLWGTASAWLMATPIWADPLHSISVVAQFISTVCGAIIGMVMLYRLLRHRKVSLNDIEELTIER